MPVRPFRVELEHGSLGRRVISYVAQQVPPLLPFPRFLSAKTELSSESSRYFVICSAPFPLFVLPRCTDAKSTGGNFRRLTFFARINSENGARAISAYR